MAGIEWKLTVQWSEPQEQYVASVFSRMNGGGDVSRWICRAVILHPRPKGPHKPERDFGEILRKAAP